MSENTRARDRARRRPVTTAARLAAVLLALATGTLALVGLTALPASAHHPTLTAQAACDGTVSYTATAWRSVDGPGRENPDVRIMASVDGGTWVQAGSGAFAAPTYSFSGTRSAGQPFPDSLRLRAYAAGTWGDGAPGGQYTAAIDVAAPTGCEPPEVTKPAASIDHDCTGYDITLDNSASTVAVTFTTVVDWISTDHEVAAGAVEHVTGAVAEDTDTTVVVSAAGDQLASATFHTDCTTPVVLHPTAQVSADCTAITAVLDNSGSTGDVTYTLTVFATRDGAGEASTTEVAAGASVTRTWPASSTAKVVVEAPGMDTASAEVAASCTPDQPDQPDQPGTPDQPDTPDQPTPPATHHKPVHHGVSSHELTVQHPTRHPSTHDARTRHTSTHARHHASTPPARTTTAVPAVSTVPVASVAPAAATTTLPNTGNPVSPWLVALAGLMLAGGVTLVRRALR